MQQRKENDIPLLQRNNKYEYFDVIFLVYHKEEKSTVDEHFTY